MAHIKNKKWVNLKAMDRSKIKKKTNKHVK